MKSEVSPKDNLNMVTAEQRSNTNQHPSVLLQTLRILGPLLMSDHSAVLNLVTYDVLLFVLVFLEYYV